MSDQLRPLNFPVELCDLIMDKLVEVEDVSSYMGGKTVINRLPGGAFFDGKHEEYLAKVLRDIHTDLLEGCEPTSLKDLQEFLTAAESRRDNHRWTRLNQLTIHVTPDVSGRSVFSFEAVWQPQHRSEKKKSVTWTIDSLSSPMARPLRYYIPDKIVVEFRGSSMDREDTKMAALLIVRAKMFDLYKVLRWMVYREEQQLEIHFREGPEPQSAGKGFWDTKPHESCEHHDDVFPDTRPSYYEILLRPLLNLGPWCNARIEFEKEPQEDQDDITTLNYMELLGIEERVPKYQLFQKETVRRKEHETDWWGTPGQRSFDKGIHSSPSNDLGWDSFFSQRMFGYLLQTPLEYTRGILDLAEKSPSFSEAVRHGNQQFDVLAACHLKTVDFDEHDMKLYMRKLDHVLYYLFFEFGDEMLLWLFTEWISRVKLGTDKSQNMDWIS